jgi:copper chaperone CopZ
MLFQKLLRIKTMKNSIVMFIVAAITIVTFGYTKSSAQAELVQKYEVKIKTSAYSQMCKNRIETELKDQKGVVDAYLDLSEQIVTITYNHNEVKSEKLKELIADMGYDTNIIEDRAVKSSDNSNSQVKLNR